MRNRNKNSLVASLAASVLVVGIYAACDSSSPKSTTSSPSTGRLTVAVAIQPQIYFVQRIGGEWVDEHAVLSPGQSHGAFDPSAQQMAKLLRAKAFFRIGVAFEGVLIQKLKEMSPGTEIVDTRDGIELKHLAEHEHPEEADGSHDHVAHAHGEGGHECGDNELDPHIWLDPYLVRVQAKMIYEALKRHDPAHADIFNKNLAAFDAELVAMDKRLQELFKPHRGKTILVFHPSFAYFCERYGLKQLVIETQGKEPGPRRLAELIEAAKATNAKVVFSQTEYSAKGAEAIAEAIGGRVLRVAPQSADWANNLESMSKALADSFAEVKAGN